MLINKYNTIYKELYKLNLIKQEIPVKELKTFLDINPACPVLGFQYAKSTKVYVYKVICELKLITKRNDLYSHKVFIFDLKEEVWRISGSMGSIFYKIEHLTKQIDFSYNYLYTYIPASHRNFIPKIEQLVYVINSSLLRRGYSYVNWLGKEYHYNP